MHDTMFSINLVVQGGSGAPALQKALRPTTHRLSAADARLLEESLRFGVTRLFAADLDSVQRSDADANGSARPVQPAMSSGKAIQDSPQDDLAKCGTLGRVSQVTGEEMQNVVAHDGLETTQTPVGSEMNDDNEAQKDGTNFPCHV